MTVPKYLYKRLQDLRLASRYVFYIKKKKRDVGMCYFLVVLSLIYIHLYLSGHVSRMNVTHILIMHFCVSA